MLLGEAAEVQQVLDPQTGVRCLGRGQSVGHLGMRLRTAPSAVVEETYAGILGSVRQVANHWVSRQLVHVAKQAFASKVAYYDIFIPVAELHARELATCLSQDLGISCGRVRAYTRAFRRLQPHRLVHPSSLTLAQIVV